MEDGTSQGTTHDLLLALAGRVDDDLLSWARELVALGEDARAVELLTASLVAARAVLPEPVHAALVAAARAARTDLGPAAALPRPSSEVGTEHRFIAPDGHDPVAGALLDIPTRPLAGCSVLLARRLTPAGSAPGPLPHPVVLVRVHTRSRPADVLAYQLSAALERAGAPASVEALTIDGPVFAYHAAALDSAVELRNDATDAQPWRPGPAPRADRDDTRRNADRETHRDTYPYAHRDLGEARRDTDREFDQDADLDLDLDLDASRDTAPDTGHAAAADDQEQPTTVLPAAVPARPVQPSSPDVERHSLAPEPSPERPVDRPAHPLAEQATADRALLHTAPMPEPARPPGGFGADETLGRRNGAPLPWRPVEEHDTTPEPSRPEPADEHELADTAESTTARIRPARRTPEREPDRRSAVTGRLPIDGDNVRRLDGRDSHHDDRAPYVEPGDGQDEGQSPEPEEDAAPEEPLSPHPLAAPRRLPVRAEPRQPRPTPAPTAAPSPLPAPDTRPRPGLTPISRASVPDPIPLVRRDGPTPAPAPAPRPMPVTEPRPAVPGEDDRDDEPPVDERREKGPAEAPHLPETRPERVETAAMDSLSDPLNGPLHQPLLAPLLDPTTHDHPLGPGPQQPAAEAEPVPDEDEEWSEEWLTGRWAMAPSALDERSDNHYEHRANGFRQGDRDHRDDRETDTAAGPVAEPTAQDRPSPRPAPLHPARHRYLDAPAGAGARYDGNDLGLSGPPGNANSMDTEFADDSERDDSERDGDERHDDAERYDDNEHDDAGRRHDEAAHHDDDRTDDDRTDDDRTDEATTDEATTDGARDGAGRPGEPAQQELGLRSESLARLSDADRQLLARLQAELVEGRPRAGRRTSYAGRAGSGGSRRNTPPDLAG